ncbi:MAG: hypothetical protein IJT65_08405 [Eubacterium sp.]|nr:hypothetical protein [Eubacterium sp.]
MSKKKTAIVIVSSLILLIVLGVSLNNYRIENGATKYLAKKYNWEISDIKEIEYKKGYFDVSLFPLDFYINKYNPKWIYEYKGRTFNVEYTNGAFADNYQLDDIFKWCTEFLQENVDKDIIGVEISSEIIYHTSEYPYEYILPWNQNKVFSKKDAKNILCIQKKNVSPKRLELFYKVDNINTYGKESKLFPYRLNGNEKYDDFCVNKNHLLTKNEYTIDCNIYLINNPVFSRELEGYIDKGKEKYTLILKDSSKYVF